MMITSIFLSACAINRTNLETPNLKQTMTPSLQFEVTGYSNGSLMPSKFVTRDGGGQNVSIGLRWQALPAAESYALLLDDKHPIANHWVHWLVVDIPNTTTEITEGASRTDRMPKGSRELRTSWGRTGYDGPEPPVGSGEHEYVATLYALDVSKLDITEKTTHAAFLKTIESHIIAQESWSGFYER